MAERRFSRANKVAGLKGAPSNLPSPSSLEELLPVLRENVVSLLYEYDIAFAYLAGSWARGQQHKWSDIDIFVSWPEYEFSSPNERLNLIVGLNVKASDATHLDMIEIRILEKQAPHVQFYITTEGILLYERSESEREQFIEKLLGQYYDHMVWYRSYLSQSLSSR